MAKYTYYVQVKSDEHRLYLNEITEWFSQTFGITDANGKPPYGMLRSYLQEYEKEHGITPSYYNRRSGLKRVYPFRPDQLALLAADYREQNREAV